jgi:hypothetical protein
MAEGRKWFFYGCFGCLGIVGLFALVVGVMAFTAFRGVRSEKVQQRVLSQEVPRAPGAPVDDAQTEPDVDPGRPIRAAEAEGRVILDLSRAEFHVEPARPGEPLRVEASYDESSFELSESLNQPDDGPWSYEVTFRGKRSNLMNTLRMVFGGSQPVVRIYLPVHVPLELEMKLDQGGAIVELGGLWLTEADLRLSQGGFQIDVDQPLRQPLERLTLHGSMGGMEVSRLGNASPRKLDVDFSMGGLELDLRGQWITDSEIAIKASMGGVVLRLPRDVTIEGLESDRIRPPEEREIEPPTLRFDATSSMGEVEVYY